MYVFVRRDIYDGFSLLSLVGWSIPFDTPLLVEEGGGITPHQIASRCLSLVQRDPNTLMVTHMLCLPVTSHIVNV